jgi:aryl-alcohol dehydrogenase-like predicted oxidoreductase
MKLALGTAQFGMNYGIANLIGRTSVQEVEIILHQALLYGIDTLDTAIAYGESESVLGQLGIGNWKTITKLPVVPNNCSGVAHWVRDQIKQSMERLGVPHLYGVLLHRPRQLLDCVGPFLYAALQDLKDEGKVHKIGVSVYCLSELEEIFNAYSLDIVQAPFNILDRSLVLSGLASRLRAAGIEVHARSVFLQGLLLMSPSQRPAKFNRWGDIWNVWDGWLAREGVTPLEGCLRYVCNSFEIDTVVVGVNTSAQLNEIVKSADGQLFSLPDFSTLKDARLINPASWSQI